MRFLMALTTAIILSGCAPRVAIIGGTEDMIQVPAGAVIQNVPIPTTEKKSYDLVTQKDGYWVSKDAINRYKKAKVGE